MTRGLVIGKFMPIHRGHVALIRFAASQCDELIVSMSFTPNDPIPPAQRFDWIKAIFADDANIKPAMVEDNFDDDTLPLTERTRIWAAFIRRTYPHIDVIFSSETYGEPFAANLGAKHVVYDLGRRITPVSATRIREKPLTHWEFIPEEVRPYFVKKICFFGAESTGKSYMSEKMAARYNTVFVPEVARELITTNTFTVDDIVRIGIAHDARIQQLSRQANRFLFCDTDAITTQIYSDYYLHTIPSILYTLEAKTKYDQYFLFDVDVPWVQDGLRDLGHKRREMFDIFKSALEQRNIPYHLVSGNWQEREDLIDQELRAILQQF